MVIVKRVGFEAAVRVINRREATLFAVRITRPRSNPEQYRDAPKGGRNYPLRIFGLIKNFDPYKEGDRG